MVCMVGMCGYVFLSSLYVACMCKYVIVCMCCACMCICQYSPGNSLGHRDLTLDILAHTGSQMKNRTGDTYPSRATRTEQGRLELLDQLELNVRHTSVSSVKTIIFVLGR